MEIERRVNQAVVVSGDDSLTLRVYSAVNLFQRIGKMSERDFMEWWVGFTRSLFILYQLPADKTPDFEALHLIGMRLRKNMPSLTCEEISLAFDLKEAGKLEMTNPLKYQRFSLADITDLISEYLSKRAAWLHRAKALLPAAQADLSEFEKGELDFQAVQQIKRNLVDSYRESILRTFLLIDEPEFREDFLENHKLEVEENCFKIGGVAIVPSKPYTADYPEFYDLIKKSGFSPLSQAVRQKVWDDLHGRSSDNQPNPENEKRGKETTPAKSTKDYLALLQARRQEKPYQRAAMERRCKTIFTKRIFEVFMEKQLSPEDLAERLQI